MFAVCGCFKFLFLFCGTVVGKIADISVGGVKMIHTGSTARFLGKLCKINILSEDFAIEFRAKLVDSTKVDRLKNLSRFKFVSLPVEHTPPRRTITLPGRTRA